MKKQLYSLFILILSGYMFLLVSCSNESRTIPPLETFGASPGGSTVGYYYPEVTAVYPANGALNVPTDTTYIIVFNIPVDETTLAANITVNGSVSGPLTSPADYTISSSAGGTYYAVLNFTVSFSGSETVTINIGSGIIDSVESEALRNPGNRTFTFGTAPDTTAPVLQLGTRTPLPFSINRPLTQVASVTITEANNIDITSVNSDTFYLVRDADNLPIPGTRALIGGPDPTITLNPSVPLETSTVYRVEVTPGIKDLSGNNLAAGTNWTFTTTATETDPYPGAPTITVGLSADSVTNTSSAITWITDEPTNYTLQYGQGDDTTSFTSSAAFSAFHAVSLGGLTAGKRYWVEIDHLVPDYQDISGNAGTNSSGPIEFNTTTNEGPSTLRSGAGNQGNVFTLNNMSGNGFAVVFTDDNSGDNNLYGQRFNNAGAIQWGAGGQALFNEIGRDFTYMHMAEDGANGIVLLASRDAAGIRAKRIPAGGGFTNWEGPTAANTPGLLIDAAGFNGNAVTVGGARVLYAWQEAGNNIQTAVRDIGAGAAVQVAEWKLDNGQNPHAVTDSFTDAIVAYENGGRIYAHKINQNGVISWGTIADHLGTTDMSAGYVFQASHTGTADLSGGHDWSGLNNEEFDIDINLTGVQTIVLDASCADLAAVITHINNKFIAAGIGGLVQAVPSGNNVEFVTTGSGSGEQIDISYNAVPTWPDALLTLGMTAGTYTGDGWTSSPENFDITVNGSGPHTVNLNADCFDEVDVFNLIDGQLPGFGIDSDVEVYISGGNEIGFRTFSTGILQDITLANGAPNGLATLGLTAGSYNGTAHRATTNAAVETILEVQEDGAGGIVILYKIGATNRVYAQRLNTAGTAQWGANGYILFNGIATSEEKMGLYGGPPVNGVIVVANQGNDILARGNGASNWGPTFISQPATGTQENPRIFPNGASTRIVWDDDRFQTQSGHGIFGMQINAATGAKSAAWNANASGTADQNGHAIFLNNFQFFTPNNELGYDSSASNAIVIWEDYRAGNGSDLLYIDLDAFTP